MNYFYLDDYGIVHGTKDKAEAEKRGKFVESAVECGELNKKGTFVGGYPVFKDNFGTHQVFIYTKEHKITVDNNIDHAANVGLKGIPIEIQQIAKELGYTE